MVHGINLTGPNLKTHNRHYLQQAEYSWAEEGCEDSNGYIVSRNFISHEKPLSELNSTDNMGEVVKCEISHKEQKAVLKDLWRMNINAHSLFHDAESLCNSISYELFEKPNDSEIGFGFFERSK